MPQIYLASGESFEVTSAAEVFAVGGSGTETVSIKAGVTGVVLDANVDKVELGGKVADFTYKQVGTKIEVYSGTELVSKIPVQEDGTDIAFGDGTLSVKLNATNTLELGGTAITETAAAVVPVTIDSTATSSTAPTVAKETTFSIDTASATVVEGDSGTQTVEFTITRTGDLSTADNVTLASSGTATSALDYAALASTTVNFAANVTEQKVTLTINGDTDRELDETLILTLSNPSKGVLDSNKTAATLTITNDDANIDPTVTLPSNADAFIGKSTDITGVSVDDTDDNILTVTLTAANSSQVTIENTAVTLKDASGNNITSGTPANVVVISGSESDIDTALAGLKYSTNATTPGNETLTIKVEDPFGGTKTEVLTLNIGESNELTSGNDSLLGSSGNDEFSGTLSNLSTADTIKGGAGSNDTLKLTGVDTATIGNSITTGNITEVEILDITSTAGAQTYNASGLSFNNELTAVNITDGDTTAVSTSNDDAITISDFKDGGTVNLLSKFIAKLTLSVKDGSGSSDDITVTVKDGATLGVLDIANDMESVTIESNGSAKNTVSSVINNSNVGVTDSIIITGTQALDLTTSDQDGSDTDGFTLIDGSAATAALTIDNATDTTATTLKGGTANDTITGGINADTITGGTGVDSITGGAGADTFSFAAGDTGSTTATADVIVDLLENDLLQFTHSGFTFAEGNTLKTSASDASVAEIYIDQANNQIVIETSPDGSSKEVINIPLSATKASFTYDATLSAFKVGAAPLSATNDEVGNLTVVGKAIGGAAIVVEQATTSTLNGNNIGVNAIRKVDASDVTGAGITVTNNGTFVAGTDDVTIVGSAQADAITLGAGNDTITGGEGADTILGSGGTDTIILTESSATTDTIFIGRTNTTGTDLAVANQGLDTVTGFTAGSTNGDVLSFDIGGVVVTNSTEKVATLSADGATLASIANSATASDVDIVLVQGSHADYSAVQTILNATGSAITDNTDGAVVVWQDTSGNSNVYFDTDISAGTGTGTALVSLTGVAVADLNQDNFDVVA